MPIKSLIVACSKLEEVVLDVSYEHNMKSIDYLYGWVDAGFKPPNLSIINGCYGSMKLIEVGQNGTIRLLLVTLLI